MTIDVQSANRAITAVAGIPQDRDGPVFRAPWEAQAFAMAVTLHDRGVFTWQEWAAALTSEIRRVQASGDADTGETYYRHWLATLEALVTEKSVTTPDALRLYRQAWGQAADRTPHGQPILLAPQDFPHTDGIPS